MDTVGQFLFSIAGPHPNGPVPEHLDLIDHRLGIQDGFFGLELTAGSPHAHAVQNFFPLFFGPDIWFEISDYHPPDLTVWFKPLDPVFIPLRGNQNRTIGGYGPGSVGF
jgi:hypothetical protein